MKLLTILFFTSSLLFSQGEHIYNDAIGFGANYIYSGNGESSGSGASIGISILGTFDMAFEYGSSKSDLSFDNQKIKSTSTLFNVAYNSKLKSSGNLKIMLGYLNLSSHIPYNSNIDASGFTFGLLCNYKIVDTESFILMPGLGIMYGFVSASSNRSYESADADIRTMGLEINFDFALSESFKLIFAPSLSMDLLGKGNSVLTGISVGLLINALPSDEDETSNE